MTLSGSRGLIRAAKNPNCQLQLAMILKKVSEPEFYRRVTGQKYPGEYGLRPSAQRRGYKMEENAFKNNAAELRRALAERYGGDPDRISVLNFADMEPGASKEINAKRLYLTRKAIREAAAGNKKWALLIQPHLRLPYGPGPLEFFTVIPDFAFWSDVYPFYITGDLKSFIVRDNVPDQEDLEDTRLQGAIQYLALKAELERYGKGHLIDPRAAFVFATPYGLKPAPAFEDNLPAEVHQVQRGIEAVVKLKADLARIEGLDAPQLENMMDDLSINFQEKCFGTCIMAGECEKRFAGRVRALGDAASDMLGPDTSIDTLVALLDPTRTLRPEDEAVALQLRDLARALGYTQGRIGA